MPHIKGKLLLYTPWFTRELNFRCLNSANVTFWRDPGFWPIQKILDCSEFIELKNILLSFSLHGVYNGANFMRILVFHNHKKYWNEMSVPERNYLLILVYIILSGKIASRNCYCCKNLVNWRNISFSILRTFACRTTFSWWSGGRGDKPVLIT